MYFNIFFIYLVYTPIFLVILFDRYFIGTFTTVLMLIIGTFVILINYNKLTKKHFYNYHTYLILWIFLSTFWSRNPSVTLNSAIMIFSVLMFTVSFMFFFYNLDSFIRYAFHFMLIVLLINFGLYFFPIIDSVSYDVRYGSVFHGLFAHKNGLGKAMTIFALFSYWLIIYATQIKNKALYFLCFIGSFYFILISKNSGSLAILVILILLFNILIKIKSPQIIGVLSMIAVVLPFYLVLSPPQWLEYIIVNIFNRDLTYTGRTYIWTSLNYYINSELLLGHGYQAFWNLGFLSTISLLSTIGFNPTHAHNGILDILLNIGLIGLILYLLIIFNLWIKLINRKIMNKYIVLGIMMMTLVVYNNIFEVDIIYPMSIFYVLQVLIYYYSLIGDMNK